MEKTSNRIKRISKKLLSGSVAAFMALQSFTATGFTPIPVMAAEETYPETGNPEDNPDMNEALHFIIRHWHTGTNEDGELIYNPKAIEGFITPGRQFYIVEHGPGEKYRLDKLNADLTAGGQDLSPYIESINNSQGSITFKPDLNSNRNETFSGYSISAGRRSVEEEDNNLLKITYGKAEHLVKSHVFYRNEQLLRSSSESPFIQDGKDGMGSSSKVSKDPEVDVRNVYIFTDNYEDSETGTKFSKGDLLEVAEADETGYQLSNQGEPVFEPALQGEIDLSESGFEELLNDEKIALTKIYSSTEGLHTDKSVKAISEDNRTFEIDLESWYLNNESLDVGFVLDASGSMAFTANNPTPIKLDEDAIREGEITILSDQTAFSDIFLDNKQLDAILDNHKTDNTKLRYGGYSYYIYDNRSSVSEFVPIGYWSGNNIKATSAGTYAISDDSENVLAAIDSEMNKVTDSSARRGWYYVNSTAKWDANYANGEIQSGKSLIGVRSYKAPKSGLPPYSYQFDNTPSLSLKALGLKDEDDKTEADGKVYVPGDKGSPLKFYVDANGYLKCFYSTSNERDEKNPDEDKWGTSYVYSYSDSEYVKVEALQRALGTFITKLNQENPGVTFSGTRFSTNDKAIDNKMGQLIILDRTDDVVEANKIMSVTRAPDGGTTSGTQLENGNLKQFNYGLTGQTTTRYGLRAFSEKLVEKYGPPTNSKRYLILFTDGKDTDRTADTEDERKEAYEIAEKLKKEYNYTIIGVMLTGGPVTPAKENEPNGDYEDARDFLTEDYTYQENGEEKTIDAIVSKDADGKPLFFSTDEPYGIGSGQNNGSNDSMSSKVDTLVEIFSEEVLQKMLNNLSNYSVRDTIDPRFDLIDSTGRVWNLDGEGKVSIKLRDEVVERLDLKTGTKTSYIGTSESTAELPKDSDKSYAQITLTDSSKIDVSSEARTAKLFFDQEKNLFYLQWDGQDIPVGMIGTNKIRTWKSVIQVKAKEDFIGGNAILTNGNDSAENYVYDPADPMGNASSGVLDANPENLDNDSPSKGFPRVAVNVGLDLGEPGDVDLHFLGDEYSFSNQIRSYITGNLEGTGTSGNSNNDLSWEYLERLAWYLTNPKLESKDREKLLNLVRTENKGLLQGEADILFADILSDLSEANAVEKKEKILDKIVEILLDLRASSESETKSVGFKVPYAYLLKPDEINNAGTADHQNDVIGFIEFSLVEKVDNNEADDDNILTEKKEKKFTYQTTFTPYGTADPEESNNDRETELTGLTKEEEAEDKVYGWNKELKPAAYHPNPEDPTDQEVSSKSSNYAYELKVISGAVGLEVEGAELLGDFLDHGDELTISGTLIRHYDDPDGEPREMSVGTLNAVIGKDPITGSFQVTRNTIEYSDEWKALFNTRIEETLPLGSYQLTKIMISGYPEGYNESNFPLQLDQVVRVLDVNDAEYYEAAKKLFEDADSAAFKDANTPDKEKGETYPGLQAPVEKKNQFVLGTDISQDSRDRLEYRFGIWKLSFSTQTEKEVIVPEQESYLINGETIDYKISYKNPKNNGDVLIIDPIDSYVSVISAYTGKENPREGLTDLVEGNPYVASDESIKIYYFEADSLKNLLQNNLEGSDIPEKLYKVDVTELEEWEAALNSKYEKTAEEYEGAPIKGFVVWYLKEQPKTENGEVYLKVNVDLPEGLKHFAVDQIHNQALSRTTNESFSFTKEIKHNVTSVFKNSLPKSGTPRTIGEDEESKIKYTIDWANYKGLEEATVVIREKLDPGVSMVDALFKVVPEHEAFNIKIEDEKFSDSTVDGNYSIKYDPNSHEVVWTLKGQPANAYGSVELNVHVNENSMFGWSYEKPKLNGDEEDFKVFNQGNVELYNSQKDPKTDDPDDERKTNLVEHPVPKATDLSIEKYQKLEEQSEYGSDDIVIKKNGTGFDKLLYQIIVRNIGRDDVKDAVVVDNLPGFLRYVSESLEIGRNEDPQNVGDSGITVEGSKLSINLGNVEKDETITIQFKAEVNGEYQLENETWWVNHAIILYNDDPEQSEQEPSIVRAIKALALEDEVTKEIKQSFKEDQNNLDGIPATANTNHSVDEANLPEGKTVRKYSQDVRSYIKTIDKTEISIKSADNNESIPTLKKADENREIYDMVYQGDTIQYQILAVNWNSTVATVTVTDRLDQNLIFVEAYRENEKLVEQVNADNSITWTFNAIPAGETVVITVVAKVREGEGLDFENVTNTASITINGESATSVNVENPVIKPVNVKLNGTKVLKNTDAAKDDDANMSLEGYKFAFKVTPLTDNSPVGAFEQESSENGIINLFGADGITFTKPGEYVYFIEEVSPEIMDRHTDVKYTTQKYTVKVIVTEDIKTNENGTQTGSLKAVTEITTTDKGETKPASDVRFTNEYSKGKVFVPITATKTLSGGSITDPEYKNKFEFEIKAVSYEGLTQNAPATPPTDEKNSEVGKGPETDQKPDDKVIPDNPSEGDDELTSPISTDSLDPINTGNMVIPLADMPKIPMPDNTSIKNDGAEINFGSIKFEEEGIYTYTINEKNLDDPYIIMDKRIYTVVIKVFRDTNGDLSAEVTITRHDPDENSDEEVTKIEFNNEALPKPVDPLSVLKISKSHKIKDESAYHTQEKTIQLKDSVYYQILVENTGDDAISNVVVKDPVPSLMTVNSSSLSAKDTSTSATLGTITAADGVVLWKGDLASKQKLEITFDVTADSSKELNYWINHAYLYIEGGASGSAHTKPHDNKYVGLSDENSYLVNHSEDPAADNAVDKLYTEDVMVKTVTADDENSENETGTNLVIEKKQGLGEEEPVKTTLDVDSGDTVTYYITVTNEDNQDSGELTLTDTLADGLELVEGSISDNGTSTDESGKITITWNLGSLKAGDSKTVSFKVKVPSVSKTTEWPNTAELTEKIPSEDGSEDTYNKINSNTVRIKETVEDEEKQPSTPSNPNLPNPVDSSTGNGSGSLGTSYQDPTTTRPSTSTTTTTTTTPKEVNYPSVSPKAVQTSAETNKTQYIWAFIISGIALIGLLGYWRRKKVFAEK